MKEIALGKPELKRVFEHAGGENGVRAILKDFYARMSRDLLIGYFFDGHDTDAIADKQAEFLLRAMGARATYSGKAPAQAHEKLPKILRGHFDRRLRILEETLRGHGLEEEYVRTWVAFENAFRDAIVEEEGPAR